jgi:hypothetical protein
MNLVQPASAEVALRVMESIGWSLQATEIRTGEVRGGDRLSYLSLLVVSSGTFDTLQIFACPVDVVYAYLPTYQGVMRLPVPVGYHCGGQYVSLNGADDPGPAGRDSALSAARTALPRGQTFALSVMRASYADGVDRSDCSQDDLPDWCQLAVEFHRDYPEVERLFLSKILASSTWMPVGWLYSLYPDGTAYSTRVPLPAEVQD